MLTDKELEETTKLINDGATIIPKTTWQQLQGKTTYTMDKFDKVVEFRHGYRTNGAKKTRLINLVNKELVEIGSKGVNIHMLFKLLKMKPDALNTTTKEWTGVLGAIKGFRKDNAL